MLAAMNNSVEIVQLLLDEGVDVNFVEQVYNYYPWISRHALHV